MYPKFLDIAENLCNLFNFFDKVAITFAKMYFNAFIDSFLILVYVRQLLRPK